MRVAFTKLILATGFILGSVFASADNLGPGSPPPALDVKTWYKGTAVTEFDKNKTYVVEFWATWCGPCIQSIPHITELAKKNTDVTFIGVSIWEEDKDSNVKNFIDKMGEKMDYNVGYSGNKTGMSESWMQASGQNGIPTAFIIKNNEVQWIGHPMDMENPLAEVKAGTFKLAEFKAKFDKEAEASRAAMAIRKEMGAITTLIKSGKLDEAKGKIDAFEAKNPTVKMDEARFLLMSKQDLSGWNAKVKEMAAKSDPQLTQTLFSFAMDQTQKSGNVAQGNTVINQILKFAKKDDVMPFYFASMFFNETNEPKKALANIEKALTILPSSNLKDNKQAKEALEKMRDEFAAKAKAKPKTK
ncbi:MAG: TlpA disulfide reductase family protein [Armatimonadota bacterium]